jgi:hypothetical protein
MVADQVAELVGNYSTNPRFKGARLIPHVPLLRYVGFDDLFDILKVEPFYSIKPPLGTLFFYGEVDDIREVFISVFTPFFHQ